VAEPRKKKKAGGESGGTPPASPPREPDERRASSERLSGSGPAWVSREEPLVFPADPVAPREGRITLPSSGLAADILARADAVDVQPAAPAALVPVAPAAPGPPAPAAEAPLRAHNISFFAAPVREERKAVEATEHLATFYLSTEEYGVDVRLVQEIIRVSEITQVPRAPDFIKGVINLRGRIIPVVDLKRKLHLGEVQPTRQSRIVVVKLKDRLVGLLVDGASQVLKIPVSAIEAAPEEVLEVDANYIRGVAKLPERLIILMDLQKILALELREEADDGPA
jgi:purine-binding chemotaxis protein CheW